MFVVESRTGKHTHIRPPFPGTIRVLLAAALVTILCYAVPSSAQESDAGWTFENDGFAELWFHGLAVVGYYGFGPMPLYDPGYVLDARSDRQARGLEATPLEGDRATFLRAFQNDDAFEVLHFVPAYYRGAGRSSAMESLKAVAEAPSGVPPVRDEAARVGSAVVAQVLASPAQRETLRTFLQRLEEEWTAVVAPRRQQAAAEHQAVLAELKARWQTDYEGPLSSFLEAEELGQGSVMLATGLGAEGRFVPASGPLDRGPVVALSMPRGEITVDAVLSSLVRELCFPAVRRAFVPFEGRFPTRVEASRASDLAATRCGELLLERHAPAQVAAYRTRFGIPASGTGRGFLSASGQMTGAAAFEGQLEAAIARELNLDLDGVRADALPVGRN